MKYELGFIGCGNMGGSLAAASAAVSKKTAVYDINTELAKSFEAKYENIEAVDLKTLLFNSDFVVLGVKPQVLSAVADEIKNLLGGQKPGFTLISMLAGTSVQKLSDELSDLPIIRIMPNLNVSVGEGVVLYCKNDKVTDESLSAFLRLFAPGGKLIAIDEGKIDAASAVSGCGPAFVFKFIQALADGAVECGIPRKLALELAIGTVKGSAALLSENGAHPIAMADAVCSPGGTTIAGCHELENGGFNASIMNAVVASYKKNFNLK